ncbi:MAG: methyl-galactoside transport system substrate-binding protein [Clostridiales bacterium]|nr:methyl-galactoside transport system substrate-binding protein [Clostridiales bacterium]MDN5297844.1 methyl-galactoside transport system substrate-binding protein [Clostridiales bacterium]
MRKFLSMLLVIVMVLSMAACSSTPAASGSSSSGGASDAAAEKPMIGVTIYKYDDNFMSFVRRAIETEAGDKVELSMNDSQNSQATQNDQVDTMISKGAKALAINLVDPQAADAIITKAKAADIPVVFFNKEPDATVLASYDKAWYVGTTSSESGVIQGELISQMWQDNADWDRNGDGVMNYVLLKGEPGHPDAEARTKYAVDTVVAAGIQVNELELQTGMWDSVKGKELMDAWIAKHGDDIEVVIANNDGMALGAIQSLTANGYFDSGKYMPVFGVDAIPDALEQIKGNKMAGTVLNDAKNQGKATFELAYNVAMGKDPLDGTSWTLDDTKAVRVPYVAVTMDNIAFGEEAYK